MFTQFKLSFKDKNPNSGGNLRFQKTILENYMVKKRIDKEEF